MYAEQFLRLIRAPYHITSEDIQALKACLQSYPYFQAAHALLAKAAYDQDAPSASQAVHTAAIYATDRNHFKALLEGTLPFATPVSATISVAPAPEVQANFQDQEDTPHFVNDFINSIQHKAQKAITKTQSLKQLDSIQAFLQSNVNLTPSLNTASNTAAQVDLTQESTTFYDDIATETLAQILWQQGKLQRALTIYEQLILKFPEKRAYFTTSIKAIKQEM
ncbi:MAG: hypothetical protein ACX93T_02250 [Bacteroidota bacterium]